MVRCFSKMNYNQIKGRNRLLDKTTTVILHVQDTVVPNPLRSLDGKISLRYNKDNTTVMKRSHTKHVGRKVCCMFEVEGRNDGHMERFHGEVTSVKYDEDYAEWTHQQWCTPHDFRGHLRTWYGLFADMVRPFCGHGFFCQNRVGTLGHGSLGHGS